MSDYYGGFVRSRTNGNQLPDPSTAPQPTSILDRIRNWVTSAPSPTSTAGILRDQDAKTDAEIDKATQ